MKRTVVMVVMDGWGVGKKDETNPIHVKNPPTINFIKHNYKAGVLQASGIAVGLPWDEEGNSEVGHLTLGSGRVLYQHYPRISIAIRNRSFFSNEVLVNAVRSAKAAGKNVNILGILTEGNVHASIEHIKALIELAAKEDLPQLNVHFFTDGKDGPEKNGSKLLRLILDRASELNYRGLKIGSIAGRYYAMDRDGHLDRTERAFSAITGGPLTKTDLTDGVIANQNDAAVKYIEDQYKAGFTDEYIEPAIVNRNALVQDGDSLIFFNFREDSIRQITERILASINGSDFTANPELSAGGKTFNSLRLATFTVYNERYKLPVAFPPENVVNPLGKVISDAGLRQLRVAESNKYAHVTYFFNGFQEIPFKEEYRVLIPSQNVARHDEHPEMMAREITERVLQALSENIYDFILINYANADIVAHTGNYNAAQTAVEVVDEQIKKIMDAVLKIDGVMLITADHGNCEKLIEADTGLPETQHNTSPVPVYIIGRQFAAPKDDWDVDQTELESSGLISDVAPTILQIMGLPVPDEMTGISLLKILR